MQPAGSGYYYFRRRRKCKSSPAIDTKALRPELFISGETLMCLPEVNGASVQVATKQIVVDGSIVEGVEEDCM